MPTKVAPIEDYTPKENRANLATILERTAYFAEKIKMPEKAELLRVNAKRIREAPDSDVTSDLRF